MGKLCYLYWWSLVRSLAQTFLTTLLVVPNTNTRMQEKIHYLPAISSGSHPYWTIILSRSAGNTLDKTSLLGKQQYGTVSHFDLHAHSNKNATKFWSTEGKLSVLSSTDFCVLFFSSIRIFHLQHVHQNDTEFSSSCIVSNIVLKEYSPNKKPAWKVSFS